MISVFIVLLLAVFVLLVPVLVLAWLRQLEVLVLDREWRYLIGLVVYTLAIVGAVRGAVWCINFLTAN